MPGPAPKPASQRRRRNKPTVAATLPAAPKRRTAPKLPGGENMLAETRAWWRMVWKSPMSSHWLEADRPAVVRLAHLQDLVGREVIGWSDRARVGSLREDRDDQDVVRVELAGAMVSVALLAEMRQIEDRLGLTPMARKRLQWEVEDAPAAPATAPADEVAARRERFKGIA